MAQIKVGNVAVKHAVTMLDKVSGSNVTGILDADFRCLVLRGDGSTPAVLVGGGADFTAAEIDAVNLPGTYEINWAIAVTFAVLGETALSFYDVSGVARGARTFDVVGATNGEISNKLGTPVLATMS